jgi:hypothetical protein
MQSDNAVLFELSREAGPLFRRLQVGRPVWVEHHDGTDFAAVSLRSEPEDLAHLLRTVESWIGDRGLSGVRFELDGRRYTLRAGARTPSPSGRW